MSAGGKGDAPRPKSVSDEQYAANFDAIFRKPAEPEPESDDDGR
jgi:hypothetical protein